MVSETLLVESATFRAITFEHGELVETGGELRTAIRIFDGRKLALSAGDTHYFYCFRGPAALEAPAGVFPLASGMYGSLNGAGALVGGGAGFVASRRGYRGMFQLGGPIEETGRLRYIDGCTDSLLLSPVVRGAPCLNHLHIPAKTRQTPHTHPSLRVGMIVRGTGSCVTPEAEYPLEPGLTFLIEPDKLHSFVTDGRPLDVVVYHPDSDTGPTHEDHPMVNRTIIPGGRR